MSVQEQDVRQSNQQEDNEWCLGTNKTTMAGLATILGM